ncbi:MULTISPECIES: type I DNA topoisomerase [Porphyromonas]|uniref:type I DNA topoisomerase n=1 Tax=Porphyromonas TaxID=836 RepID=UPI00051D453C|nr:MULTISPECIES: type I DNA topoisomerase [Porphyromonas]KGL52583.1 DNA topoisomerase I [Porphyromonas canoris]KGN71479.1 DNA topoisomerase I [Porphyromonas sp. COT-108 OH1349]
MARNLVIVESPAKSKTISKILGEDYKVMSSYGHVRDLKKKGLGIDIEHRFAPQYEVSEDKVKVVKELQKAVQEAETVWLASDEDREGEAIAWHLYQILGLKDKQTKRIAFHEITRKAILEALESPRDIDYDRVDAQQARRVLDRIVGFELSPILWHKVRPALSAGRVQSAAVRILVEREREIQAFKPESGFRIVAELKNASGQSVKAVMEHRPSQPEQAEAVLSDLIGSSYVVSDIQVKPGKRTPPPPFTTSTLQQEASRLLGFSVTQTMVVAQSLYENGHITYMRTDSVNLSSFAIATTAETIEKLYGKSYVKKRNFTTKTKGAQEAHEAIRPTNIEHDTISGTSAEKKLYDLIRKRTMATQMKDAELERTVVAVKTASPYLFYIRGEQVRFDGFLKVYLAGTDDDNGTSADREETDALLPAMSVGDALSATSVEATQKFTQRPARYSEAALVKKLEELGIGRPSTYAPTIQTIQKREYVDKRTIPGVEREYCVLTLKGNKISAKTKQESYGADKGKLVPTDIGIVVNDFLVEAFPKILSYDFTANVEQEFDAIAEGEKPWIGVIEQFYSIFHPNVVEVMEAKTERRVGERYIGDDPKTGRPIYAKIGRFGPLLQLGDAQPEGEKPTFTSIPSSLSIETISLEEALELFRLPRTLGEWNEKEVQANNGRFGPYVRWDKLFVSIPKDMDLYTITMEEAVALIEQKIESEKNKRIASFDTPQGELLILNGRYGPYIEYSKKNYKIPKGYKPEELSLEACLELVEEGSKKKSSKKSSKKNG